MVYVDALMDWGWRLGVSCHMLPHDHTDLALEELHQFAECIGMKRAWFQDKSAWLHYDLTASKRALAVKAGAVEVTSKQYILRMRNDPTRTDQRRARIFQRQKPQPARDAGRAGSSRR